LDEGQTQNSNKLRLFNCVTFLHTIRLRNAIRLMTVCNRKKHVNR